MNYAMATKSRAKATLLAQFLGPFGAHKFYLGKTLPGVLYLLFCWTGIPSVIALIETIIMVSQSDHEFAQRHDPGASSLYPPSPVTAAGKKRSTAALFAMFLGAFGAHHFYLKRTARGLVYLALFVLGIVLLVVAMVAISSGEDEVGLVMMVVGYLMMLIPGIMGFVDYIRLVLKKDQAFLAEYGGASYGASGGDYTPAAVAAPAALAADSYAGSWGQSPGADPFQSNAETVAYQNLAISPDEAKPELSFSPGGFDSPLPPAAPVLPATPGIPESPGAFGVPEAPGVQAGPFGAGPSRDDAEQREGTPQAPEAPKFFDNSYMPMAGTVKDSESYVPGDDNFHPSVLQIPDVNPATQMGQAANMDRAGQTPGSCLKCTGGEYAGNSIEMDGGEICMGRDPASCQLVFSQESPFVSGRHCVVSYNQEEDLFYLQDLGSTNGTFLMNDEKLDPGKFYILKEGEGFYLGDRSTSFQVGKC